MKESNFVRTIIFAGNFLLSNLCFLSRGAVRLPCPANPELSGRRAALCLAPLVVGLGLMPAGRVIALHHFTGFNGGTEGGAYPYGGMILLGNTLYGTTAGNGDSGAGTVFKVNTDGIGFTNVFSFNGYDGALPQAGLILSGSTLYGTTKGYDNYSTGTVFAVNTDGTGFRNLHRFTNSDGARPHAGLIMSGNTLYGTAAEGGSSGSGTVFAINTNGTGFTVLHSFTARVSPLSTNSDGSSPLAGLILSGNTLYGTAAGGGSSGNGTVFAVNTDGTGFTNLHSFTALFYTNSDGARPLAGLIISGNTLYGTASAGGSSGAGTVFAINTNGTGFTTLYSFTARPDSFPYANSDGAQPQAGLILSGSTLYGTAAVGGSAGDGTVFAVNTDGTGFFNLHNFNENFEGAQPVAGLILSGNTLYGTTLGGGHHSKGTVFRLSLPLRLTILRSGANVILTWQTNAAGVNLQSTTNLSLPNSWSPVAQPTVTNVGQISVSVPTSVGSKFFRLKSQ